MGCACSAQANGSNVDADARGHHSWQQCRADDVRAASMQRDSYMFTSLASVTASPARAPVADAVPPFTPRTVRPSETASASIGRLAASVTTPSMGPTRAGLVPAMTTPAETTVMVPEEEVSQQSATLNPLHGASAGVDARGGCDGRTPMSNASLTVPTSHRRFAMGLDPHRQCSSGALTPRTDVSLTRSSAAEQARDASQLHLTDSGIGLAELTPRSTYHVASPLAISDPMLPVTLGQSESIFASERRRTGSLASVASNAQSPLQRRLPSFAPVGSYSRHHSRHASGGRLMSARGAAGLRARLGSGLLAADDGGGVAHETSVTLDVLSGIDLVTSSLDIANPTNAMVAVWLRQIALPALAVASPESPGESTTPLGRAISPTSFH